MVIRSTAVKQAVVMAIFISQVNLVQSTSCVAQWGDCSQNPESCCPGLVCGAAGIWGIQCVPGIVAPAPSPPVVVPGPSSSTAGCCSFNHKSCSWECGFTQSSCDSCSSSCHQWLPNGPLNTCIARLSSVGQCLTFCDYLAMLKTPKPVPVLLPPPVAKPVPLPLRTPAPVPVRVPVPVAIPAPVSAPVTIPAPVPVLAHVPKQVSIPVQPPLVNSDPSAINDAIKKCKADLTAIFQANNTLIPKFVRLIFHDCVGGKCNGCVNLSNLDNRGLELPTSVLEQTIVPKYKAWLSRADMWVMAALTAAEVAQPAGSSQLTFDLGGYGRQDCGANFQAGPNPSLQSAHLHTTQLLSFFANKFNFTTQQTVAIMGAHALGRAKTTNSGFDGQHWTISPLELKNFYYQAMLMSNPSQARPEYQLTFQKNQPNSPFPDQFFWTHPSPCSGCGIDFLLDVDLALAVDMKGFVDSKNGNVTCALNGSTNPNKMPTCPFASKTMKFASQYSTNNAQWTNAFCNALLQMSNVGYRTTSKCGQAVCPLQAM